ncbi:hypothetical protein H4R99_002068 [Coemansia sp. RSA 1722]|nr:hypothetical protein H4R99_002068 [Coemansia sp. RSA 1722]KAJ2635074.1 hypothetical protein GGF40_003826 [Coemansia sp. RSA 1286]
MVDPRLKQPIELLRDSADTGDLEKAWKAYKLLRDLEGDMEQYDILRILHLELPIDVLQRVLRNCMPKFGQQPESTEMALRLAYIYTKVLNYLVIVSKLQKSERNKLVVVRLAMGQCLRRLICSSKVQTPEDAKQLVKMWGQMSSKRQMSQRLTLFDIRLLILGAWKSKRHMLVPYLYQMACKQWRVREENEFQKISAIVVSFYVREHADEIDLGVIKGLLEDLNDRHIRLSPSHYSMLILYFGKKRNMVEALRIFEQAMSDSGTQGAEAIYYNTFRAFNCALAPQSRHRSNDYSNSDGRQGVTSENDLDSEMQDSADSKGSIDDLTYIDDLDADIDSIYSDYSIDSEREGSQRMQKSSIEQTPEMKRAARICSSLFQIMASRNIPVGLKTYRELMLCMARFGMPEKARSVLEFALESIHGYDIKAHIIALYLRSIARTPHSMRELLWREMRNMPGLAFTMKRFPRRVLIDQFGIFDGDLVAFAERRKNPVVDGRAGDFMRQFIQKMDKATRGAAFVNCILSGNDPTGRFKGFNFPKLGHGVDTRSGAAAAVEQELVAACRFISQTRPKWMKHRDIVYNLLPVLPGIRQAEDEPEEMRFIRRLIDSSSTTLEFVAALDKAGIEDYDIGMVNHYLRVKLLGLTFQRYVRQKTETDADAYPARKLFWPSYMYSQSNEWMSTPPSGVSAAASAASSVAPAVQQGGRQLRHDSWQHLSERLRCPGKTPQPDANTVGIFALACAASGDWELGRRVWDDVFQTAKDGGQSVGIGAQPGLLQQGVRIYKHYLNYLAAASVASSTAATEASRKDMRHAAAHEFTDGAITAMFGAMDRSGVDVTSGLLCQGIRAALEVGNIDVAGALEQWQLHREYRGQAPVDFLQRYMASGALPEVPQRSASVIDLVRNANAGSLLLSQYISQRMRLNRI